MDRDEPGTPRPPDTAGAPTPGDFGAIIETSTPAGGTNLAKVDVEAVANIRVFLGPSGGATAATIDRTLLLGLDTRLAFRYRARFGRRPDERPGHPQSPASKTHRRPQPTMTFAPEITRFCAWACH